LSRRAAEALVMNPDNVISHSFLPLLSFEKRLRRFKSTRSGPKGTTKVRDLAYSSNHDGYIFSYYANIINNLYEKEIINLGLDDVVLAYRRGGSNITHAAAAFEEVRTRSQCVAMTFDIKSFFPSINHRVLKRNWARVLGLSALPDDHYKVFRALTSSASVKKRECLERLGFDPDTPDKNLPAGPLCSIKVYRNKIRGDDGTVSNLLEVNKNLSGIPQGTPISAVAANVSMIEIDVILNKHLTSIGGVYRRYSDDILVIAPLSHRVSLFNFVKDQIAVLGETLKIHPEKSEIVIFNGKSPPVKPLQYLGFLFDGQDVRLRDSTLARHWRRMSHGVHVAKKQNWKAQTGQIQGRKNIHRRDLLARFTNLGADSFLNRYAKRSQEQMGGSAIRRQLSRSKKRLDKLLSTP